MTFDPRTPVLVGAATAMQREEIFERAKEPLDLTLDAVAKAGLDCHCPQALASVEHVAVPRGRWSYANPAGEIAARVGAHGATTVLATVGVLQQSLIGDACERIAHGEISCALVVGGDTGYRLLRAQIAGRLASERQQQDAPDILLQPKEELRHPVERRAGLHMPVGLYAMMESAWRARNGWTVDGHRDRIAALWSRFSDVAALNPHAWRRDRLAPAFIREASEHNPMQAFPYTRALCSSWNVDQAAALLLCSAQHAQELGIPRSRWIFARSSAEANHMVPVSARADLAGCPGARIVGEAAMRMACVTNDDLDLIDFYSCFPFAVQSYADALCLPLERGLTLTGGMAHAGGPYNNYMLQAVCRMAELMRAGRGETALISGVSGIVTKQGFGVWSLEEPAQAFLHADLTGEVAAAMETREVLDDFDGKASVAGCTVLYGRGQQPRGILLLDTEQRQRALVTTEDPRHIEILQAHEAVGRCVGVRASTLLEFC